MKSSRRHVRRKAHALPALKFEQQSLTSFAGLVILQRFFAILRLKVRLARCFAHQAAGKVFARPVLFLQLVLHLLLGYRELRESRYCQDDPLVKRLLGLFAHNLLRELQMTTSKPSRRTTEKRPPLWACEELHTFPAGLLQRAGRLTRPHGKLTLTISASLWIKDRILDVLKRLQNAA